MTYTTDANIAHPLAIDTASIQSKHPSLPSPPDSPSRLEQGSPSAERKAASASIAQGTYSPPLQPYAPREFGERLSRAGSMSADPLLLSSRLRSEDDLASLRKRKGLSAFYKRQNSQIKDLLKPMDDHIADQIADDKANSRAVSDALG